MKGNRVLLLNGQVSSWAGANTGVPHGFILGLLLFLVLLISQLNSLSSNTKIFADDTSLFLVMHNTNELNNDLYTISCWTFQCKTNINPDRRRQDQEIIFGIKPFSSFAVF